LRPKEVCRALRISYATLRYWIKGGKIKAVKTPSGRYLIPRSELDKLGSSADLLQFLSCGSANAVVNAVSVQGGGGLELSIAWLARRLGLTKGEEICEEELVNRLLAVINEGVAYEAIKRFSTYLLNELLCNKKMFGMVSRTWNPVTGCEHECIYCWARKLALTKFRSKERYREGFKPRLNEEEFKARFKASVIFVSDMGDLFGEFIPSEWIRKVLNHVKDNPKALFLLLTKNPGRYFEFLDSMPDNAMLGTTIETDDDELYEKHSISRAPRPSERLDAMRRLPWDLKFISIEPILDFTERFADRVRSTGAFMVYVGYDNYNNRLPEPPLSKVKALIDELRKGPMIVVEKTIRPSWREGLEACVAPRDR